MSNQPNLKQLDAVVRVLGNTKRLLETGLFQGASSQAVFESHSYITSLFNQSQEQLQKMLDEKLADKEEVVSETQNAVSEG